MLPNAFHFYFDVVLISIIIATITLFGTLYWLTRYCKYKTIAEDIAKNQARRFEIQQQEKETVLINHWEKEKFKE